MLNTANGEVEFAIATVREAGLLAREVQREMVGPALTKEDRSPVTVADYAIQALVACALGRAFPNAVLVAEEGAAALRTDEAASALSQVAAFVGRRLAYATPETVCAWIDYGAAAPGKKFWTLDPIDGTKGFLRGDQYAVALALIEDGQVRIGALACPNLVEASGSDTDGEGSLVIAVRGEGAWVCPLAREGEFRRLRVSERHDPAEARVLRSFEAAHTNTGGIGRLVELMNIQAEPVLMDSQAKYAVLAAGAGDLLFRLLSPKQPDYREMIWDQAAGSLVVEEAGGRITDLAGKPLDFTAGRTLARNRGVLASNGYLHEAALKAVRALG
jgi:3'(2'), 5'-bisphosphate nucleotidase